MEFLDPHYRKKHARLLFIGYGLIAGIIGLLTTLLVLQASGYNINRGGEVVVNSLLFVDSHPGDAEVYLDGELQSSKTDARLVVPEGEYLVEVKRDGYRSWQKQLLLEGKRVEFARYPFLFPENLETNQLANYTENTAISQSPDRRWLLIQNLSAGSYELYDLDDEDLPVERSEFSRLESATFEPSIIEIMEWSNDNRNLLLKVTDIEQQLVRYFIYELRSSNPPILITDSQTPIVDIRLNDRKVEEVYILYEGGTLTKHRVEDGSEQVIALAVEAFEPHDTDIVMYVAPNRDKMLANVIISDDLNEYTLQTLSYSSDVIYSLAIARFDGDFLYAVGSSIDERMTIYEDPIDSLESGESLEVLSKPRVSGLRELKFSQNTRFIAGLVDTGFVVYDAEEARPLRFDINGLPANYEIQWMDGHRLFAKIGENLSIFEFDGQNQRTFESVIDEKSVFFDKNYDNMFTLRPVESNPNLPISLNHTKLIVEED